MNTILQFCYNWFEPENRAVYLSVIGIMNIVGGGFGNAVSLLFVSEDEFDPDIIKDEIYQYHLIIFFISAGFFIVNLIFFRGTPPKGYGYINEQPKTENTSISEYFKLIKKVLKIKKFRIYSHIFALTNSSLSVLGSVINLIFIDFKYDSVK